MIHNDFETVPFFQTALRLGISEEKIFIVRVLHPKKASRCQNYRQVAYRGEWTKISADDKHPSVVYRRKSGVEPTERPDRSGCSLGTVHPRRGLTLLTRSPAFVSLTPPRQALTCTTTAPRPTRAPRPPHPWLLASSLWPWKQSKALKASSHHY